MFTFSIGPTAATD